ncbi:rhythmically expressed gene 2 protein-like [Chrysoperla carnea]|uniref:rhythmically expressed gene 2 protein-like n=1 Tax=Chrysoperla carnea TaxID=189513 RepID=UPI001D0633D7|nr:rhythmically expressed gene 2 protein-like [Chrysoperla carnea]
MPKLSLKNIRLITFDVTGTLLKFRNSPGREYANIGNLHGIKCTEQDLNNKIKATIKNLNKTHPNYGKFSGIGWEKWWHKVIQSAFEEFTTDEEKLQPISKDLIAIYQTSLCWKHTFGAVELLDTLKSRDIQLGVISNFDPRLSVILKNLQIDQYFKFVINSFEAGVEKPDRRIFRMANNFSNVKNLLPAESLHIGNSLELDYKGAINADWKAALISKEVPEHAIPEHAVFASLSNLKNSLLDEKCVKLANV